MNGRLNTGLDIRLSNATRRRNARLTPTFGKDIIMAAPSTSSSSGSAADAAAACDAAAEGGAAEGDISRVEPAEAVRDVVVVVGVDPLNPAACDDRADAPDAIERRCSVRSFWSAFVWPCDGDEPLLLASRNLCLAASTCPSVPACMHVMIAMIAHQAWLHDKCGAVANSVHCQHARKDSCCGEQLLFVLNVW